MSRAPGRGRLRRTVASDGSISFVGDYVDATGKRHRRVLGHDRHTAQRALDAIVRERDLELLGLGGSKGLDLDVASVVESYLAELSTRSDPRRVAETKRMLERVVESMALVLVRHVTHERVSTWRQARIREGASHKTVNNQVVALRAAINHARALGRIGADPLDGLRALRVTDRERRRSPRALSEDEIGRLLAAAEQSDAAARGPRAPELPPPPPGFLFDPNPPAAVPVVERDPIPREPLLRTLLETGARWGELVAATWLDLDAGSSTLLLRGETTKTLERRVLPLPPELVASLLAARPLHEAAIGRKLEPADPIFRTPEGAPWTRDGSNFRRWLRSVLVLAGIERRDAHGRVVHVHAMRHTFVTRLARAGIAPTTGKKLSGHRSTQVINDVYTHIASEDAHAAMRALKPLPPRSDAAKSQLA